MLSRLAGLVRDLVTSYFFGASMAADAFFMAWRIPNLLRRFLGEGAFTAAFVPVFTGTLTEGGAPAAAILFKRVFTLMVLVLAALSVLGIIFTPEIVSLIAPGFREEPEKFRLTVYILRILFPYIFFMGLGALFMGALNSCGYFAAPALGPFVGNLAMIVGMLALSPHMEKPVLGLVIGAMTGGGLQLAIQLPSLKRAGLKLRPDFKFRTPDVKKILLLMGPATLGAAVYQLSIFINSILASYLPDGSVSCLNYADRLMQFPLGIFSVALGAAVLPVLSRQSLSGDQAGFIDSSNFALGLSFFITVPAMVGLATLALPLVTFLFQRGAFRVEDAYRTAGALQAFVVGLPFLSGAGILARVFYSRSNTRTPAMVAIGSLVVGTASALILMRPFQHVGLALASSISSLINFVLLYFLLLAKEKDFARKELLKEIVSYFLIAGVMGAAVWPMGLWAMNSGGFWMLAGKTLSAVAVGVLIYFGLSVVTGRPHVMAMLNLVRRRLKRK